MKEKKFVQSKTDWVETIVVERFSSFLMKPKKVSEGKEWDVRNLDRRFNSVKGLQKRVTLYLEDERVWYYKQRGNEERTGTRSRSDKNKPNASSEENMV